MPDPLCGHQARDGFHVLKDQWCQKSYLKQQAKHLRESLKVAIDATLDAAPERTIGYALNRLPTQEIDETERERRWERSVFRRWSSPGLSPVEKCWDRLVAFQVPLFATQEKDGWGYIDLLGIFDARGLSVVELKKEPRTRQSGGTDSSESPLRMILEAAAYALAIKKNWVRFRQELLDHLAAISIQESVRDAIPQTLKKIQLVGAAPAAYWIDWLPVTAKGESALNLDVWREFDALRQEFENNDLPISFVSISGDVDSPGSLAAQPLKNFPLLALS